MKLKKVKKMKSKKAVQEETEIILGKRNIDAKHKTAKLDRGKFFGKKWYPFTRDE